MSCRQNYSFFLDELNVAWGTSIGFKKKVSSIIRVSSFIKTFINMQLWIKLYNNKSMQSSYVNEFTNGTINHNFGNYTDATVNNLWCIVNFLSRLLARKNPALFADIWNKEQAAIQKNEQNKHLINKLLNWGKYFKNLEF